MGRQTQTDDASEAQTYEQIAARLKDSDSTEVSEDELLSLGVLRESSLTGHVTTGLIEDSPVVASGRKDIDPLDYYLVRIAPDRWLALKQYRNLIERDGGSKWVATDAGDVSIEPATLNDSWTDHLREDYDNETLAAFEEAYRRECERMFSVVDECMAAAWDGHRVSIECREPWLGWDSIREEAGVSKEDWQHDIRPAIASGRPSNPRHINTDLSTEYAVELNYNSGDDDE